MNSVCSNFFVVVNMVSHNSGSSLHQYLMKKNNNSVTTSTLASCPIRNSNICQKTYTIYHSICSKCHNFYIGSTIRIKEHLNTHASSFYKHLIKCKNNDNHFSIKIKAIVCNVGNLSIKEALLIAKLHSLINNRLELNPEYIIN